MQIDSILLQVQNQASTDTIVAFTIVLAVATLALVGVTYFYARQTKEMVKVLKRSNEIQFLPHIKINLVHPYPGYIIMHLTNSGRGSANDVKVTFKIKEITNFQKNWTRALVVPGDKISFELPKNETEYEVSIKYFQKNQITLIMDATYADTFGIPLESHENIDITEYCKEIGSTKFYLDFDEMTAIRRELQTISQHMYDIKNNLNRSQTL